MKRTLQIIACVEAARELDRRAAFNNFLTEWRDKIRTTTESGGLGATASASSGSNGEAEPRTGIAAVLDSRATGAPARRNGPSVASPTYIGVNAAREQAGADDQAPVKRT